MAPNRIPSLSLPLTLLALAASLHPAAAQIQGAALVLPDDPSTYSTSQSTPPQPQPAPPQNETEAQRHERERKQAADQVKAEEKQRIGGVVPNFNVVIGGTAPPITPAQKFDLWFHSATDPFTIATAFVLGGYDEVSGGHNGYHWGAEGYFKRVGAHYADTVDGAFWGNAVLPSLLHQDPRYFRKGTGTIKSRILYSALTTVICRGDNGKKQFNVSNVAGNFIAGGIANLYYPKDERGIGQTFETGAEVTAEGAVASQVLEFSPDIISAIKRHHQEAKARKAATTSTTP